MNIQKYSRLCDSFDRLTDDEAQLDTYYTNKKGLNRPKKPSHATIPIKVLRSPPIRIGS